MDGQKSLQGRRTEKEIETCKKNITELVYAKDKFIKARNMYSGVRDPNQFRHLEENYGLGNPTSIKFEPVIKLHIDELVGEFLSNPKKKHITCKDKGTISKIFRDKMVAINKGMLTELRKLASNIVYDPNYQNGYDPNITDQLNQTYDDLDNDFISEYEKAAQNILTWVSQDKEIDYENKMRKALTNLLVYGYSPYRVLPTQDKKGFEVTIPDPCLTYIERNPNSEYFNKSDRMVIRRYCTKNQILAEFGDLLTPEQVGDLDDASSDNISQSYLLTMQSTVMDTSSTMNDGILGGLEAAVVFPFGQQSGFNLKYYIVDDCEWIETEKKSGEYIQERHRCVRIANKIYIPYGKIDYATRDYNDPKKCTLSLNGKCLSDGNGQPYSLILKIADLQDKYDITNFYEDLAICGSGTQGDWVDVARLPTFLGGEVAEKLVKWQAYKKTGMALYNSAEENMQGPPINTAFNGYDDTLKVQTIQAFETVKQSIKASCSNITGVLQERVANIEQRDAVTNVQSGIKQSSLITKQYFFELGLIERDINIDILDICKIVFKKGITGTLILGDKRSKIFTALPEYYSVTNFDINIVDEEELSEDKEFIKQFSMEMIKSAQVDPTLAIVAATSKSLTEMKESITLAYAKQSKVNQQTQQAQQQSQDLQKQNQQLQQAIDKLQKQLDKNNEAKQQLEKEKMDNDKELNWYKAKADRNFKDESIDLKKKDVQLQGLQLLDNNKQNDPVRQYSND
jgi:hypothetical protein